MMKLLRPFAILAALLYASSAFAQTPRTLVSLNQGWRFHAGEIPAASAANYDDSEWDAVSVPHVFPPAVNGTRRGVYRGEAWYRRTFPAPEAWKGQRVFLRFDAVNLISDVFLNGEKLGEHRGGFAAFTYEITGNIHLGQPNQLSVRVDNRLNQDVAPIELSLLYGGIYRNVSLIVTGPVDITPMDYSSPGVFLTQDVMTRDQAVVHVWTEIDSNLAETQTISVRLLLIDGEGKPIFKATASGAIAGNKTTPVTQTITIPRPHLWNGVADPYLYSVRIDLLDGTKILDSVVQPLGLRFFRVDPRRGFVLNGVARQIHGVCLHQDYGELGWATGPAQEQEDLKTLREMGVDGLRLVHYQHSQSALSLYDRTGMIVWSEIPMFQQVGTSTAFRDNIRQQLVEMIRQNYNHPSIVMWSLFNELASKSKIVSEPIVEDLNKVAHKEDPTRLTVGASSGDTIANEQNTVNIPDLIADNNYAGWYFGAPVDMAKEIDKWNGVYDLRGLAISEYGAGARIGDHQQGLSVTDTKPVDPYGNFQPEEWQALVHEGTYAAIRKHADVWGNFIWLAFDSGGIARGDGSFDSGNIKGLVTQNRKTRKDAYFFYQANWTTAPMLYLTSRRAVVRTQATTPVKVYSNAAAVTLKINGKEYGTQKPNDLHVFVWKEIPLNEGENRVEVSTADGLHDEAVWSYRPGSSK